MIQIYLYTAVNKFFIKQTVKNHLKLKAQLAVYLAQLNVQRYK